MNDKLTDDVHDKILNACRYIRQAQRTNREVLINSYKYSSKEAHDAYIDGFIHGANFAVSDFVKTFGKED